MSALTSPGLGELKRLINEAAVKRRQLAVQIDAERRALELSAKRLRFAQTFIIRLFTQSSIPRLVKELEDATERLEEAEAEFNGCFVEVDFAFDTATLDSYAALVRSFESLSRCQCIWDVTTLQATDRLRERTVATTAYSRTSVAFDFAVPEIVKSSHRAMRMGNATGPQIYLYPGFLMMRDAGADFALIEYQELKASFAESRFIEAETVPADTKIIGQTWKKTNKDGTPDRRFKDNYSIPIVLYAEMLFESPAGLREAYQFSDFEKANGFHQSLLNHQRALIELEKSDSAALSEPTTSENEGEEIEPPVVPTAKKPPGLALDWLVLGLGILTLGLGGNWSFHHRSEIVQNLTGNRHTATTEPVNVIPPPAAKPQAPVRKRHKRAVAPTATAVDGAN